MADDPNTEAARVARVARETADKGNPLPPDLEAAWAEWIKGIQGINERARTLLRGAFEAGAEAGGRAFAARGGRLRRIERAMYMIAATSFWIACTAMALVVIAVAIWIVNQWAF